MLLLPLTHTHTHTHTHTRARTRTHARRRHCQRERLRREPAAAQRGGVPRRGVAAAGGAGDGGGAAGGPATGGRRPAAAVTAALDSRSGGRAGLAARPGPRALVARCTWPARPRAARGCVRGAPPVGPHPGHVRSECCWAAAAWWAQLRGGCVAPSLRLCQYGSPGGKFKHHPSICYMVSPGYDSRKMHEAVGRAAGAALATEQG
jgi:hypothetical protein